MTLINLPGMPLVMLGGANKQGSTNIASMNSVSHSANEYSVQFYGRLFWEDGGTHTIDTTGASSIGVRTQNIVTASPATVMKIGLASMNFAAGPPGRAFMSGNQVVFDVYSEHGTTRPLTSNAWNTLVPTSGSKTIAHNDIVVYATQLSVKGGTDTFTMMAMQAVTSAAMPGQTLWQDAWIAGSNIPIVVFCASDGTLGYIAGGYITNSNVTLIPYNNTSNPREYGNIFRTPFPCMLHGFYLPNHQSVASADASLMLYSTPFGTPVVERSLFLDGNAVPNLNIVTNLAYQTFATPFNIAANTDYVMALKPETSTNVLLVHKQVFDNAHLSGEPLGKECCGVSRPDYSSPFTRTNSGKDLFVLGGLIGGFDDGAGSGGGGGGSTAKYWNGTAWIEKPMKTFDGSAWV